MIFALRSIASRILQGKEHSFSEAQPSARRRGVILMSLFVWVIAWCGSGVPTDSPNRLIGADGRTCVLEDLTRIADDPDLSEDERRQAFRDPGEWEIRADRSPAFALAQHASSCSVTSCR